MNCARHHKITLQEEKRIVVLLKMWLAGELLFSDIRARTGRGSKVILEIGEKYGITKPLNQTANLLQVS